MGGGKTLAELAETSGIPARTIRFYIARGLLEGPVKAGRGAVYTGEHLARLGKIKALQAKGHMLSEIVPMLDRRRTRTVHRPSSWWRYAIDDDIVFYVRADVSPWRTRQIRAVIDDMAARLARPQGTNDPAVNPKEEPPEGVEITKRRGRTHE